MSPKPATRARIHELALELAELIDGLPRPPRSTEKAVLRPNAPVTFTSAMTEARNVIMKRRFPDPEMPLPDMDGPGAMQALVDLARAGDPDTLTGYLEDIQQQIAFWLGMAKHVSGLRRIAHSKATRETPFDWSDRYTPDDPRWVDVATVADRYNLSPGAVREHCKKHRIGEWRGGVWRVSLSRAKQLYDGDRVRRR